MIVLNLILIGVILAMGIHIRKLKEIHRIEKESLAKELQEARESGAKNQLSCEAKIDKMWGELTQGLTNISIYTQLLAEDTSISGQKEKQRVIEKECNHMLNLIKV